MMEVAPVNDAKPSQSQANIKPKSERPPLDGGIQVNISIVDSPSLFNIEIGGFNNLNVKWLHSIMKSYENRLWMKVQVPTVNRTIYLCMRCRKGLYRFETIRNHLYKHLEIFPFKCCACEKSYTSVSGLHLHTKKKHSAEE